MPGMMFRGSGRSPLATCSLRALERLYLRAILFLLTCCLAMSPKAAMAEDSFPTQPTAEVKISRGWYGWQIMLADLGAISSLWVGGILTGNSRAFAFVPIAGGVGFYAGGPLVHAAHSNGGGAGKSLLLRFLIPVGGAALGVGIGALMDSGQRRSDCSEGCAKAFLGIAGFGAGMLGAMVTDWATAREPMRALPPASNASSTAWSPTLVVTRQSAGAGIVVRF
jgi:hypothetical protein